MEPAQIEARTERIVRHLAIEVGATNEQQEQLCARVKCGMPAGFTNLYLAEKRSKQLSASVSVGGCQWPLPEEAQMTEKEKS
jgi:hypothetical protein